MAIVHVQVAEPGYQCVYCQMRFNQIIDAADPAAHDVDCTWDKESTSLELGEFGDILCRLAFVDVPAGQAISAMYDLDRNMP